MARWQGIRDSLRKSKWDAMEADYRRRAVAAVGEKVAGQIARVSLTTYGRRAGAMMRKALAEAAKTNAPAVYFHFDMLNDWAGDALVCNDYKPESDGDDDWASKVRKRIPGELTQRAFGDVYTERCASSTGRKADAVESYLIVRTLAAIGRAVAGADCKGVAMCAAYHDQDLVFRLYEPPAERRRPVKRPAADYYRLGGASYVGGKLNQADAEGDFHYGVDWENKRRIKSWKTVTYETKAQLADLIGGTDMALLCSERLRKLIDQKRNSRDAVQWLRVKMKAPRGKTAPYFLLHMPRRIEVVDYKKSKMFPGGYVAVPCICRSAAKDRQIFAPGYKGRRWGGRVVVVARPLKDAIEAMGAVGVLFKPLPSS